MTTRNRHELVKQASERRTGLHYPSDFAAAVGRVVLYAAAAEDKAGELIRLGSDPETAPQDWAESGQRLQIELRKIDVDGHHHELIERLGAAFMKRNDAVHGSFIVGQAAGGLRGLSMRRLRKSADGAVPGFAMTYWDLPKLDRLAREFEAIALQLDDLITQRMRELGAGF